jgi:hypothetical protein
MIIDYKLLKEEDYRRSRNEGSSAIKSMISTFDFSDFLLPAVLIVSSGTTDKRNQLIEIFTFSSCSALWQWPLLRPPDQSIRCRHSTIPLQ